MPEQITPAPSDTVTPQPGVSAETMYPAGGKPPAIAAPATPPPAPADAAKPTDDANKGTDGKARVVPESYDLKLPDGSPLDAKALESAASFAKEKGLTNEEAQAIVERESALMTSYVERQNEALAQRQKEWVEAVKNDKEIGGPAMTQSVEMAKRVVDRFGTDAFKKALNETGLGNHPELVRFVARIGKGMSEDQLVIPGAQAPEKKTLEQIFYPTPAK